MGNNNIKQSSSRVTGDGTFGGQVSAGSVYATGGITGSTADIKNIKTDDINTRIIQSTSLSLQKGDTKWGFDITDKDDLCVTQNGANLTCISKDGVLF